MQQKTYKGLTEEQVLESRKQHGANVLTPPKKDPLWKQFLGKFADPMIIILLVAGVLSIGISCYEFFGEGEGANVFFEPIGIFIAILLATGLAFYFEHNANKAFSILNQVNDSEAVKVIRNGNVVEVPKMDVVVGDIVVLNTGDDIPADGLLLEAVTLNIDESTLTGEPSCHKTTVEADFDKESTYPSNMVLRGTKVVEGHGVFEVKSVGDATENGKVFEEAQIDSSVKTPLNEQLDGLGKLITRLSYILAALIIVGRIIHFFVSGESADATLAGILSYMLNTVMIAVTLLVVSVPEGLPMAVTLSLAYSMRSMLKTNNLVRKMHACETMGATTVICTDKTGTLTQNKMQVYESRFYGLKEQKLGDDEMSALIAEGIAVNSTASLDLSKDKPTAIGNPTEGALLLWLHSQGLDYKALKGKTETIAEVPFSTERKHMATVVRSAGGEKIIYVKGAPEIVFGMCANACGNVTKSDVDTQLYAYQQQAMRTLGFAYQILEDGDKAIDDNKVVAERLTFLGIVAISDPVRSDVPAAVKECLDAGISVKIVTGDTPGTAKEIGRQIGLWTDADTDRNVITGPEFAALSDDELRERILDLKIIARARPMDKKRLVETLQELNQVVAVTGDGTNDAPALNAAHVGLSMGDGTSVAKEASDITIVDNSFSSIGRAVMWGRSLYQNIQRFLLFQLTVNVSACLIVLVGAFMGTESPLTVTQMLWVNLIMDTFGAMALASLPPSSTVMKDKPRDRSEFIIKKPMYTTIVGTGFVFFLMLLGILYVCQHADIRSMSDFLSLRLGEAGEVSKYEHTLIFSIFVWANFWNMFNARLYETGKSIFGVKFSNGFKTIILVIILGQIAIVELLHNFFDVDPIFLNKTNPEAWKDFLVIFFGTSLVLWVREIWHLIAKR